MFYTFKIKKADNLPAVLLTLGTVILLVLFTLNMRAVEVSAPGKEPCLVIDPGHGGIDGGAVSISGKKESDINLSIGLKLQQIAEFYGVQTLMTRVDDSMRTDVQSYSEHEDLVHRTEIINSAANSVLISIHQNCYPTSQPSGAQVLYADNEESKWFGELTHRNLTESLDAGNRRVAEPASKSLYITSNVSCPAILVECGFMSNFSDLEKLLSPGYQSSLAVVFMASFLQFCSQNKEI